MTSYPGAGRGLAHRRSASGLLTMLPKTYYQWSHGGHIHRTINCNYPHSTQGIHGKIYWAWDRSLGAWVHYTGIAWGWESTATVAYA